MDGFVNSEDSKGSCVERGMQGERVCGQTKNASFLKLSFSFCFSRPQTHIHTLSLSPSSFNENAVRDAREARKHHSKQRRLFFFSSFTFFCFEPRHILIVAFFLSNMKRKTSSTRRRRSSQLKIRQVREAGEEECTRRLRDLLNRLKTEQVLRVKDVQEDVRDVLERGAQVSIRDLQNWLDAIVGKHVYCTEEDEKDAKVKLAQTIFRHCQQQDSSVFIKIVTYLCHDRMQTALDMLLLLLRFDTHFASDVLRMLNLEIYLPNGNLQIATRLAKAVFESECCEGGVKSTEAYECMQSALKGPHRHGLNDRREWVVMLQRYGIHAPWNNSEECPTSLIEAASLGNIGLCHEVAGGEKVAGSVGVRVPWDQALSVAIIFDHVECAKWLLERMLVCEGNNMISVRNDTEWPSPLCSAAANKTSWAIEMLIPHLMHGSPPPLHGMTVIVDSCKQARKDDALDVAIDNDNYHHIFALSTVPSFEKKRVLPSICLSVKGARVREKMAIPFVRKWIAAEPNALTWTCTWTCNTEYLTGAFWPLDIAAHDCSTLKIMAVLVELGAKCCILPERGYILSVLDQMVEKIQTKTLKALFNKDIANIIVEFLANDLTMIAR